MAIIRKWDTVKGKGKCSLFVLSINMVYCIIVLFFLLDEFTSFDIKNQTLKSFIYFGVLIGTPAMLFWNLFSERILLIVYPMLFLILIIIVHPIRILFQSSAWETRAIFYEHKHKSCKTIELQWQDIGALGYNRREVEVTYFTPFFMITRKVPPDISQNPEWIKVDDSNNIIE